MRRRRLNGQRHRARRARSRCWPRRCEPRTGPRAAAVRRRLQGRRDHHGRAAHPFEIHVISTDAYDPAGLDRLAARGVTDVIVGFRADSYAPGPDTQPLSEKLAAIEWYATNVIAPYRGQAGPVA